MFDMRSAKEISPSGEWGFSFYLEFEDSDWGNAQKDIFEILTGLLQGNDYQYLAPKTYNPPYQMSLRINNQIKAAQLREYFKKNCNLNNVPVMASVKHIGVEILAEDGFDVNQLTQALKDSFSKYVSNGSVKKKNGSKGSAKILIRDRK